MLRWMRPYQLARSRTSADVLTRNHHEDAEKDEVEDAVDVEAHQRGNDMHQQKQLGPMRTRANEPGTRTQGVSNAACNVERARRAVVCLGPRSCST